MGTLLNPLKRGPYCEGLYPQGSPEILTPTKGIYFSTRVCISPQPFQLPVGRLLEGPKQLVRPVLGFLVKVFFPKMILQNIPQTLF